MYLFVNAVIIIFIVMLFILIGVLIFSEDDIVEKFIRLSFFISGSVICLTSDIFRITIPEIILNTFINAGFLVKYITPAIVGVVAQFILVETFKQGTDLAIRLLILVSPFIIFSYAILYGMAISESRSNNIDLLLPNIFFSIGVIISFGLNYRRI